LRNETRNRKGREQRLVGSRLALKPDFLTSAVEVREELPIGSKAIGEPARQAKFTGFLEESQAKLRCLAFILVDARKTF